MSFTVVHLSLKCFSQDYQRQYFDLWAWTIIGVLSIAYPINQIFLWMLFNPIDLYLDKKIFFSGYNFSLNGNWAPIKVEQDCYEVIDI